jgi:UDP-glucose 4-epimerase
VRIIVTGGAGFIGSHVVETFLAAGHEVLALDSLWEHGGGRRQNVAERALFVHMDVRDENLTRIFQEFKPDVVSHHAAQHSVAIGSRDPIFDAQVNVIGLLNVLENCVKGGVRKVIFASSAATFGDVERLPIVESTPQRPVSPYGISKMVAEHYLRFYKSEHGLDFTALRYGNDSDGEQTRDYVYVRDVARANALALERGSGGCYCIGTGERTSVNAIYRALNTIAGFEAPVVHAPRRPGDARDVQFDPALAKAELGWEAQTTLLTGMQETYDYFKTRAALQPSLQ